MAKANFWLDRTGRRFSNQLVAGPVLKESWLDRRLGLLTNWSPVRSSVKKTTKCRVGD